MADLQVSVAATRYVDAVVALRRARRHWHRLDAALVQVLVRKQTPAWLEAWEALRRLDHAIPDVMDSSLQVPRPGPVVARDVLPALHLVTEHGHEQGWEAVRLSRPNMRPWTGAWLSV